MVYLFHYLCEIFPRLFERAFLRRSCCCSEEQDNRVFAAAGADASVVLFSETFRSALINMPGVGAAAWKEQVCFGDW